MRVFAVAWAWLLAGAPQDYPKLAPVVKSPATLRRLRAQEVLERIGSADARTLLKSLSESAPSRRERFEAAWTLKRLAR